MLNVQNKYPFTIDAMVLLPEHLHFFAAPFMNNLGLRQVVNLFVLEQERLQ